MENEVLACETLQVRFSHIKYCSHKFYKNERCNFRFGFFPIDKIIEKTFCLIYFLFL